MKALDRVHLKLKQLRNKASDQISMKKLSETDQQRLREMDLRSELRKSRNAVYAYMQLGFKNKSWKEEDRGLSDVRVVRNVELIKRDPAFRRMVEKEGPLGLADKIIQDKGGLTDAYVKAANALKQPRERIKPKTEEEKGALWKNYNTELP